MTSGQRQSSSWREEMRQDRLISAQIDREREAARTQARIAERQARAQARREEDLTRSAARTAARQQARQRRAARRADRAAWVRGHVLDLLFVPVIVVPAVLAWTAMGAYGYQMYGAPGLLLPAFSEGAMWAFAIATTLTVRRHPDRPTWHLRLGTCGVRRCRRCPEFHSRPDRARPARAWRGRGDGGDIGRGRRGSPDHYRRAPPGPRRARPGPLAPCGGPPRDGGPPGRCPAARSLTWTTKAAPG